MNKKERIRELELEIQDLKNEIFELKARVSALESNNNWCYSTPDTIKWIYYTVSCSSTPQNPESNIHTHEK